MVQEVGEFLSLSFPQFRCSFTKGMQLNKLEKEEIEEIERKNWE